MTISSENRKSGPFLGTGAVSEYPFDFAVFSADDLLVVVADTVGAESTLVLTSDYTVDLNSDQDANPGGTVVLTDPLPDDYLLVATSKLANLQPTDLTNQGGFYPQVVTRSLDRLTILVQQLKEQIGRAIKVPITAAFDATADALIARIISAESSSSAAAASAAASAAAAATFNPALYALQADLLALQAGRNLIRNRNLREVNRTRAWAGPYVMTAGLFLCDAWRAGAGGCTATEPGGSTTISAGTLVQTVYTSSIYAYDSMDPPASTPITIAWDGTAQARVNGGSYSASPLVYTPVNMPVSFELEFGTGTMTKPRAHVGTVAHAWVAQGDIEAQRDADYDYQEVMVNHRFDANIASGQLGLIYPISRMRSGATVGWATATVNTNISGTPSLSLANGNRGVAVTTVTTTSGAAQYTNIARVSTGV